MLSAKKHSWFLFSTVISDHEIRKKGGELILKENNEGKKVWESPDLVVYGDMNSLTQQIKPKTPGTTDDFQVSGISSP